MYKTVENWLQSVICISVISANRGIPRGTLRRCPATLSTLSTLSNPANLFNHLLFHDFFMKRL